MMKEQEILTLIQDRKFSNLTFLRNHDVLLSNENYYGYLYFILDLKGEPTEDLLEEIIKYKGSSSTAYEYLGTIATQVFFTFNELQHISASLFRISVQYNNRNSNAWWGLYQTTLDSIAFLNSIDIDYDSNNLKSIDNKILQIYYKNEFNYSTAEWNKLIHILLDDRLEKNDSISKLLIIAYYNTNQLDKGINLINQIKNIEYSILKKYYDQGKLSIEEILPKISIDEVDIFLENDPERIYDEYFKRHLRDELYSSKLALIQKAFKAKKYRDVEQLFYEKWEDDSLFIYEELDFKLYYLISKLYLKEPFDPKIYDEVIKKEKEKETTLYKLFTIKNTIKNLEESLNNQTTISHVITIWKPYQDLKKIMDDNNVIRHYLYDDICDELDDLEKKWNNKYLKEQFKTIRTDWTEDCSSYDKFINYCDYGIHVGHYYNVIHQVNTFHENSEPTISTYNILGVCYQRLEKYQEAYEQYSKAIQLMETHNEYYHVVIENYLISLNKAEINYTADHYNVWRDRYNLALIDKFRGDSFIDPTLNKLYKYSPFNLNSLDSLINQYFYFPEKKQLNDPIEMPKISNIGKDCLIDSEYRICSFSHNDNSMLMWSHYTDNHQGIMVEYRFRPGLPKGVGIGIVKYSGDTKRYKEQDKYIFNQFLLTKNEDWSYEKEVRLMSYKIDKIYYSNHEYPNIDRSTVNAQVTKITLGCNFPESKKLLIKNLVLNLNLKRKSHEEKIILQQAKISKNNPFSLEYKPIN